MQIPRGKPHAGCPFSRAEIDAFKWALYTVNTSFSCVNPAPVSWVDGYQRHQSALCGQESENPND